MLHMTCMCRTYHSQNYVKCLSERPSLRDQTTQRRKEHADLHIPVQVNCRLPLELCHTGAERPTAGLRAELFCGLGVVCRNFDDVAPSVFLGVGLKIAALLFSQFEEVTPLPLHLPSLPPLPCLPQPNFLTDSRLLAILLLRHRSTVPCYPLCVINQGERAVYA